MVMVKYILYQLNLVKKLYEKHPTFSEPDPNAIVWRYIDFPKLVSLLDRKALFFVKASKLIDPFEGTLPEFNKISRPSVYAGYKDKFPDDESFNKFIDSVHDLEQTFKLLKPTTLINSWYINEYESAAMWDLYSHRNTGIAIQSNFKNLSESFKDNKDDVVWIGKVNYIDFNKEWMNEWNVSEAFIIKRKSFEHEHELRAITCLPEIGFGDPILSESDKLRERISPVPKRKLDPAQLIDSGKYVHVNLDILIEQVYVSPLAKPWFIEVVKSILAKFNISEEKKLSDRNYILYLNYEFRYYV